MVTVSLPRSRSSSCCSDCPDAVNRGGLREMQQIMERPSATTRPSIAYGSFESSESSSHIRREYARASHPAPEHMTWMSRAHNSTEGISTEGERWDIPAAGKEGQVVARNSLNEGSEKELLRRSVEEAPGAASSVENRSGNLNTQDLPDDSGTPMEDIISTDSPAHDTIGRESGKRQLSGFERDHDHGEESDGSHSQYHDARATVDDRDKSLVHGNVTPHQNEGRSRALGAVPRRQDKATADADAVPLVFEVLKQCMSELQCAEEYFITRESTTFSGLDLVNALREVRERVQKSVSHTVDSNVQTKSACTGEDKELVSTNVSNCHAAIASQNEEDVPKKVGTNSPRIEGKCSLRAQYKQDIPYGIGPMEDIVANPHVDTREVRRFYRRLPSLIGRHSTDEMALRRKCEEQSKRLELVVREKKAIDHKYAALQGEHEAQKTKNERLLHDIERLKTALEQRTLELNGVEKFLATPDTFSGSEVVGTLRKLNEGVEQIVPYMADWMTQNLTFGMQFADQTAGEHVEQKRMSELFGAEFMQLLGATTTHIDNPAVVETALQVYLMDELYQVASQRPTTKENQLHNKFVDKIYERMWKAEGQAISGNWRALTHRYIISSENEYAELSQTTVSMVITGLSDILAAMGCTASKSEVASSLRSKFEKNVHGVVVLARQLNMIINAGVISEDFEVFMVPHGSPFDVRAMEDFDNSGDRVQGTLMEDRQKSVLFTMELGLTKRKREDDTSEKGWVVESVTRPKVALASYLSELANL